MTRRRRTLTDHRNTERVEPDCPRDQPAAPRPPATKGADDPHDPSCCNGPCTYCDAQDAKKAKRAKGAEPQGRRRSTWEDPDPQHQAYWMLLTEDGVEALARGEVPHPLYIVFMNPEEGDEIIRNRVPDQVKEQAYRMRHWMRED